MNSANGGTPAGGAAGRVLLPGIGWHDQVCDVEIADGRLVAAVPAPGPGEPEWVATRPLRNWHCHLDKSLAGERWLPRRARRARRDRRDQPTVSDLHIAHLIVPADAGQ